MRPCQNSTWVGRTRQPPQCGGGGISGASGKVRRRELWRRLVAGELEGEEVPVGDGW